MLSRQLQQTQKELKWVFKIINSWILFRLIEILSDALKIDFLNRFFTLEYF